VPPEWLQVRARGKGVTESLGSPDRARSAPPGRCVGARPGAVVGAHGTVVRATGISKLLGGVPGDLGGKTGAGR